jgi:hypothetical protein
MIHSREEIEVKTPYLWPVVLAFADPARLAAREAVVPIGPCLAGRQ